MLFKLFDWLLKRVPYTLAIALPNTLWAIASAVFGIFLILFRVDFETTGTGEIFIFSSTSLVLIAALLICLEFGGLRLLNIKRWEKKGIKTLNDNIVKGHISPDAKSNVLLDIYNSLARTHTLLIHRNIQYTSAVLILCILIEWVASKQLTNLPLMLMGGIVAVVMSFICTIPLYELLFFSTRRECKIFLDKKRENFEETSFLSLKTKSRFFIILMSLALLVILMLVPSPGIIPVIFSIITLFTLTILSNLVFKSIYKAFMEIKESAQALERGEEPTFYSGSLDKEIIDLSKSLNKAGNEIYNIKNKLEIQVKARTKALEEEKLSLGEKVKQRTEELQEKLKELEKFQKFVVNREIKMMELKKEISRLRGGLKKKE